MFEEESRGSISIRARSASRREPIPSGAFITGYPTIDGPPFNGSVAQSTYNLSTRVFAAGILSTGTVSIAIILFGTAEWRDSSDETEVKSANDDRGSCSRPGRRRGRSLLLI